MTPAPMKRTRALHKFNASDVLSLNGICLRHDLQRSCVNIAVFDDGKIARAVDGNEGTHAHGNATDVESMEVGGCAAAQPRFHKYASIRRYGAKERRFVASIVVGDGHIDRARDSAHIAGHGGSLGQRLAGRCLRTGVNLHVAARADARARDVQARGVVRAHLRVGHVDARGDGARARAVEVCTGRRFTKQAFHDDIAVRIDVATGNGGHGVAGG